MNLSLLCLIIFICTFSVAVIIVMINNNNIHHSIDLLSDEYLSNGKLMDEVREYNYVLEKYQFDSKLICDTMGDTELELIEVSSNAVFNSVISYKKRKAEGIGISVIINSLISNNMEWKMKDSDTVAVLANLFDNAIESAAKCRDGYINIDIKADTTTKIIITNSKASNLKIEENYIKTSKRDKREHGFGITVINEIIHKYNGKVSRTDLGDEFQVSVEVPV